MTRPGFSSALRVAIVHDWLTVYAGAERVLEQMLIMWPHAHLFTVVDFLPAGDRAFLQGRVPETTFIQKLPGAAKRYRGYLPLMPLAIEQLDVSSYDLVVSSSHAVAKGVLTGPDQVHVSYVHSPIRYAWDLQHEYLRQAGMTRGLKSWIARASLHYMRNWDTRTSNGVDQFVANSEFIGRRIKKVYGRPSEVVYPPVDIDRFPLRADKDGFFVTASRMVPYKRIPMIVEAFTKMPDKHLVVIGDGPEMAKVKQLATSNVTVLGHVCGNVLVDHIQRAKAFVFAAEEDFGISPVEAQAAGTPVIVYGKGGAIESVRADAEDAQRTGMLFHEQSAEAVIDAVQAFEQDGGAISAQACRANAMRFQPRAFREGLSKVVEDALR